MFNDILLFDISQLFKNPKDVTVIESVEHKLYLVTTLLLIYTFDKSCSSETLLSQYLHAYNASIHIVDKILLQVTFFKLFFIVYYFSE